MLAHFFFSFVNTLCMSLVITSGILWEKNYLAASCVSLLESSIRHNNYLQLYCTMLWLIVMKKGGPGLPRSAPGVALHQSTDTDWGLLQVI